MPNRSRATSVLIPERSSHHATDRASHSSARFAAHGSSTGTFRAIRSSLACARAMVTTARGLILGMSPVYRRVRPPWTRRWAPSTHVL